MAVLLEEEPSEAITKCEYGLAPIDGSHFNIEELSFFWVQELLNFIPLRGLVDPTIVDEVVEDALHVVHFVLDRGRKFRCFLELFATNTGHPANDLKGFHW